MKVLQGCRFTNVLLLVVALAYVVQVCQATLDVDVGRTRARRSLHELILGKLDKRDARTLMVGSNDSEGENHTTIVPPKGSQFVGIPIGGNEDEQLAVFMTKDGKNDSATHAYVMIHGKNRNGDHYWRVINNIVKRAVAANVAGADPNSIVVAPQFFSTRYNSGQYSKTMLAWGDINLWEAGDPATHPKGTEVNAIDALDGLVRWFQNATMYPNMQNVTVIGHGGGGQLAQRFAAVGQASSTSRVHVRYIHGDPSSGVYFTPDRATIANQTLPTTAQCPLYNTWRYGLTNFTSSISKTLTPQQYFRQYTSRDVISIVGYLDVNSTGDNTCAAMMQGGQFRRDRNLLWWRYVNTLARTSEDLTGFPGSFAPALPDWSSFTAVRGQISTKLIVVPDAAHHVKQVFSSDEGQAALFADASQLPTGWRPNVLSSTNTNSTTAKQRSGAAGSAAPPPFVMFIPLFVATAIAALMAVPC